MKKCKEINIPCNCSGGGKYCGYLKILMSKNGDLEFCFVEDIKIKHPKIGIYLFKDMGVVKLLKFIKK